MKKILSNYFKDLQNRRRENTLLKKCFQQVLIKKNCHLYFNKGFSKKIQFFRKVEFIWLYDQKSFKMFSEKSWKTLLFFQKIFPKTSNNKEVLKFQQERNNTFQKEKNLISLGS